MKDYNQVRDEYLQWKQLNPDKNLDISAFARDMDVLEGTQSRQIAYDDGVLKQFNAAIDRFFQPAANLVAPVGKAIDTGVGKLGLDSGGAGEATMKSLPRAAAEFLPFAGWAGRAARVAQVAGAASSGLKGYAETGNPVVGAINAAALPVTAGAAALGERAAARILSRGTAEAVAKSTPSVLRDAVGAFVGGNVGAGLAGELQRQATILATGEGDPNPFTTENIVSNLVGVLPEALARTPAAIMGRGSAVVAKERAAKIQPYLDQISRERGYETFYDQAGRVEADRPAADALARSATRDDNAAFIADPTFTPQRSQVELDPNADVATQAAKLSDTFRQVVEDRTPGVVQPLAALVKSNPQTPRELGQFIKDVNQSIQAQWEAAKNVEMTDPNLLNRAARLREITGVGKDVIETPEPLQRQEVTEFNPYALSQLQAEGRVPQITPEWLKSNFDWQWENSITLTTDEAYAGMIQSVKNTLIEAAEAANRQKSLELQRRAELQSTEAKLTPEQKDEIYFANVKQLPEDLQKMVLEQRARWEREITQLRGGYEQSRVGAHAEFVDQAVKNWNRETGMTRVTQRVGSMGPDGKVRYESVTKEMPIEQAVLLEPPNRRILKKQNTVSLDKLTEEGAARAAQDAAARETADVSETGDVLNVGDQPRIVGGRVETAPGVTTAGEAPTIGDQPVEAFADVAKISDAKDRAKAILDKIQDPAQEDATWRVFRRAFAFERNGNTVYQDSKKPLFRLAVQAMLAPGVKSKNGNVEYTKVGQQQRLAFANAMLGRPASLSEASSALRDYWRNGAWNKFLDTVKTLVGPESFQKAATVDSVTGQFNVIGAAPINERIQSYFRSHFRYVGYSEPLVEHFTQVAMRIANVMPQVEGLEFSPLLTNDPKTGRPYAEKIFDQMETLGLYGYNYYNPITRRVSTNPVIAIPLLNRSERSQPIATFLTLANLGHETVHQIQESVRLDDALNSPDYDVRLRATTWVRLRDRIETMSRADRYGMLQNLADTVIPPEFLYPESGTKTRQMDSKIRGLFDYATETPEETIAVYTQILMAGMASSKEGFRPAEIRDALRFQPEDVQDFMRGVYRDMSQMTGALQALATDGSIRASLGYGKLLGEKLQVVEGIGELHKALQVLVRPDFEVLRAKATIADIAGYLQENSQSHLYAPRQDAIARQRSFYDDSTNDALLSSIGVEKVQFAKVRQALEDGASVMKTGEPEGKDLGFVTRMFAPFTMAVARTNSKTAMDVGVQIFDTQPGKVRLMQNLLAPILTRNSHGKYVVDPNSPLRKAYQQDGKVIGPIHKAINEIGLVLQSIGDSGELAQPVQPVNGRFLDTLQQLLPQSKDLRESVAGILKPLSPEDRAYAIHGVNQILEVYQRSAVAMVKSQAEHAGTRVARVMQTMGIIAPAKELIGRGQQLVTAMLLDNTGGVMDALKGLAPEQAKTISDFAADLVGPVRELDKFYQARPYFMSEQRQGPFIVRSLDADGGKQVHGADSKRHAQHIVEQLKKRGNKDFKIIDRVKEYGESGSHLPEQYAERFAQIEQAAVNSALGRVEAKLGKAVADALRTEFTPTADVLKQLSTEGVKKNMIERKLVGGREDLDYIRTMQGFISQLSTSMGNRASRDNVGVMLNDPALENLPEFKAYAKNQLDYVMKPGSQTINKLRTMMSSYFLGGNLGSMAIEGLQNFVTLVPALVKGGDSIVGAYGRLGKAMKDFFEMPQKPATTFKPGSREELAYYYRRFKDENPEGSNVYDDLSVNEDLGSVLGGRNRHGNFDDMSVWQLATNGGYQLAKFMLKAYGQVSAWNSKVAFLAAFEHAQERGLQGQEAFDAAKIMVSQTSFGGGRANNPGYVAQGSKATSAFPLIHTLQQYGLGMTTMLGSYAKDAILGDRTMTPEQRKAAVKSFGVLFGTQMALAGTLGMPFVAAALTVLEKQFGLNASAAVRQGFASLAGDDEELGYMISDVAMNGIASHVLGVDVAGRTGVSNVLGTSSYNGFNFKDLLGPAPSIVENMFGAIQGAQQGEPLKAATSLLPQAFKNALTLVDTKNKYGQVQFMDRSQNLIAEASAMDSLRYAIGFKPAAVRRYQQAQAMTTTANEIARANAGRAMDKAARALLQEDPSELMRYVAERRAEDPGTDPRQIVESVIAKAVDMSTPRDLLAVQGANSRVISATVGQQARRSELGRLEIRDAIVRKLGYPLGLRPSDGRQRLRARMIDEATAQGLSRKQAIDQFEARFHPRPSMLDVWDVVGGVGL